MSKRDIKITVEHEPGCVMTVVFGLLLGIALSGNLVSCVVNIGSDAGHATTATKTAAEAAKQ